MDGLVRAAGSGGEEERSSSLHSEPGGGRVAIYEETQEKPEAGKVSKARVARRGTTSRGGSRADPLLGTPKAVLIAGALGALLISMLALRLLVCFTASTLHKAPRGDIFPGAASRGLATGEKSYGTFPPFDASAGVGPVLGGRCLGSLDNPGISAHDENVWLLSRAALRDPLTPLGDGNAEGYLAPTRLTRWQMFRAWLEAPGVKLGFLVLAVGVATLVSFAVELPQLRATWVLAGLVVALFVPFYVRITQVTVP